LNAETVTSENKWDAIIESRSSIFDLKIHEIWLYRDLLSLFIKREIVVSYKQTILGPLWFFIQPILTTLMFLLVFNKIAGLPTGGMPPVIFYISGIIVWNYFSDSVRLTSDTFVKNSNVFGKVYFPRAIMPLSVVLSNLVRFSTQFVLFLLVYFYFALTGYKFQANAAIVLLPVLLLIIAVLALSFGLLISAMTTKYRDLVFLVQFGIQLWMYGTPVIYPLKLIPAKYRIFILLNPVSSVIEAFKYAFTGSGEVPGFWLMYSACFAVVFFLISLAVFNKTEKKFMDTV
jgi:lipopolysaccharide transport system permease protein